MTETIQILLFLWLGVECFILYAYLEVLLDIFCDMKYVEVSN